MLVTKWDTVDDKVSPLETSATVPIKPGSRVYFFMALRDLRFRLHLVPLIMILTFPVTSLLYPGRCGALHDVCHRSTHHFCWVWADVHGSEAVEGAECRAGYTE